MKLEKKNPLKEKKKNTEKTILEELKRESSFLENVTVIDGTKDAYILGDISARILCVPDIEILSKK